MFIIIACFENETMKLRKKHLHVDYSELMELTELNVSTFFIKCEHILANCLFKYMKFNNWDENRSCENMSRDPREGNKSSQRKFQRLFVY